MQQVIQTIEAKVVELQAFIQMGEQVGASAEAMQQLRNDIIQLKKALKILKRHNHDTITA